MATGAGLIDMTAPAAGVGPTLDGDAFALFSTTVCTGSSVIFTPTSYAGAGSVTLTTDFSIGLAPPPGSYTLCVRFSSTSDYGAVGTLGVGEYRGFRSIYRRVHVSVPCSTLAQHCSPPPIRPWWRPCQTSPLY